MTNAIRILLTTAVIMLLGGCATSRSVVAVNTAPSYEAATSESGTAVRLTTTDARVFELKPATPDIPSLKNGEIENTAITSRAIARKRNTYGKALGDVLLPEGQTVAMLVEASIASSFRTAGYRVLRSGDPGYEEALPVNAAIDQYWSWFSPGFWTITLTCRTEVTLTAPLAGFETGRKILTESQESAGAATENSWQQIASKGLQEFQDNLSGTLPRQTAAN